MNRDVMDLTERIERLENHIRWGVILNTLSWGLLTYLLMKLEGVT